jgi:hypothetical protein
MNPVCFVIMGFGQKTDLATGRMLNLDKSYKNIIKPAVTAAGYDCLRADEIQHSGIIDVPMYEMLLAADVVIADLSTGNQNAIFELGVRVALRPRSTIIIAESQYKIPFDAIHLSVRQYEHLGPDIGFVEAMRMQKELTDLINALKGGDAVDSPVYVMLPDLQRPTRGPATTMGMAAPAAQPQSSEDTYAKMLQTAREAMDAGAFALAKSILWRIYKEQTAPGADFRPTPARPFVVQRLALASYKVGEEEAKTDGVEKALAGYGEAEALLRQLDVETTTDPETLGLWSAIHKRRAEMAMRSPDEQKHDINEAIRATERGFIIKRDYYNGTNLAYLLNLRASKSLGDDRVADKVLADRVRREVVEITARGLETLQAKKSAGGETTLRDEKYWLAATHAESLIALGDKSGEEILQKAIASAPSPWMAQSTQLQLSRVLMLLEGSRSSQSTKKQHLYVSYAWADPTNPGREMDVDRLCEEAAKRGVLIVRDKSTLKIGDFIYEFMRQIGEGDRVFVFLSNKYLRSPYCMFELFELWRNSRQDRIDFAGKIRVFTIDGTKIGTPDEWLDYTAYWVAERDRLKQKIDQVGWPNAGQEVLRRYRYMEDFAAKFSDVLALFTDVVQPKTFDEFLKYGFDDPPGGTRIH